MNRFPTGAKKIGIISIILVVIISYGLFFYLQYMTENNIRNSLFEQQKRASDRIYKSPLATC